MFEPVITKISVDEVKKLRVRRFSVIPCEGDERISVEYEIEEAIPEKGHSKVFKWQQDFMVSQLPPGFESVRNAIFGFCGTQAVDPRIAETARISSLPVE